ncbi:MAG: nuclear transport factor 2 family protein [Clostridia bacterium]|nr:nuclear transport factor 2 family protein [Clostridia bacterium]
MDDRYEITKLYQEMYTAMVNKDEAVLDRINDDSFELVHMTGMRQSKKDYIHAIMNGTLNYYSSVQDGLVLYVKDLEARLTGHSRVTAAVFGGGTHTWRLELNLDLKKTDVGWRFIRAQASTY